MQIFEITQRPVREGLLGDIGRGLVSAAGGPDLPQSPGSAAKDAAKSAASLTKQGYGPGGKGLPSSNWADKYKTVQKDPAVQQYVNSIMQGWSQQVTQQQQQQRKQSMAAPAASAQAQTQAQAQAQTKAPGYVPPTDPAEVADMKARGFDPETGQKIKPIFTPDDNKPTPAKSTVRPKYGQMPSDVAASPQGQRMLQAYGQPKGGIQKKLNEAPQEYTTPGGIVVPAGTKTDPAKAAPVSDPAAVKTDPYKQSFLKWTDSQLQSRDSRYNTITMADVRQNVPEIRAVLDKKLEDVLKARGTPQSAEAIRSYLEVAIAGVQARSQELKNTESQGSLAAASRADTQSGTVDQSLAQKGVNVNALKSFADTLQSKQARTTGNPELDAMLTKMGVRVS
jgi:ElaB/YqjD/DUF883 family membrane-anchored ribosome-binding protein